MTETPAAAVVADIPPYPEKEYANEQDFYKKTFGKEESAPKWKDICKNLEDERTKKTIAWG